MVNTEEEKRLVAAFVRFLRDKLARSGGAELDVESVEVAIQVLETSFGVSASDPALTSDVPLLAAFTRANAAQTSSSHRETTPAEKAQAERLKNEGNDLMKDGKFEEAVQKYSEAVQLDRNPIFYCNRAAAYSKLERHNDSLSDCRTALQLDPTYSKAYGRMGLAYSCLNQYREARDAYRKALELDPGNESFKNNLTIAEEKIRETEATGDRQRTGGGMPGFPGGPNPFGFDFGSILNNPAMMNMAAQVMSDPNMQSMMSGLMTGAMGQEGGPQGLGNLLEAGQRLASQMQQQNPDLVENLRRQFQQQNRPDDNDQQQNKDGKPPDQQQPPPSS